MSLGSAVDVTWLLGPPTSGEGVVEAWATAAVTEPDVAVLVQVGPGRGNMVSDRGALVVRSVPSAPVGDDRWERHWTADFALRTVRAPDGPPSVTGTPYMLLTRAYVPVDLRDEFRAWLDEEHSRTQLTVPGCDWYLGWEEVGEAHSFMNFWGLQAPEVPDGEAWDHARLTPWRARMLPAFERLDRATYRPVAGTL